MLQELPDRVGRIAQPLVRSAAAGVSNPRLSFCLLCRSPLILSSHQSHALPTQRAACCARTQRLRLVVVLLRLLLVLRLRVLVVLLVVVLLVLVLRLRLLVVRLRLVVVRRLVLRLLVVLRQARHRLGTGLGTGSAQGTSGTAVVVVLLLLLCWCCCGCCGCCGCCYVARHRSHCGHCLRPLCIRCRR